MADVRGAGGGLLADRGRLYDLLDAVFAGKPKEAIALLEALHADGADPVQIVGDLSEAVHAATRIKAAGEAHELLPTLAPATPVDHWPDCLILPGLIDAHIHFPQTQVIASFGAQLLDWLQNYTFVEEQRFADPAHSARIAVFFLDELARNGTTTAVVYGSVHPQSAEAFFAESARRNPIRSSP